MAERIEFLQMRAGVIDKPFTNPFADILPEEPTFKNKFKNFIFYYKWAIIIAFLSIIAVLIIIFAVFLQPKGDIRVLSLLEIEYSRNSPKITKMIEGYIPDTNNDGKRLVTSMEVPLKKDGNYSTFDQTMTSLASQMGDYRTMIVVSDSLYSSNNNIQNYFEDLTKEYPGNENVDTKGFRLCSEKAKKAIGWDGMPSDIYISIKRFDDISVDANISDSERANRRYQYDIAKQTLDKIIKDLS